DGIRDVLVTVVQTCALPIFLHHPLDAAHLTFDPMQTLRQSLLVVAVLHRASRVVWNCRSRSEFVTTKTLENAIAAAATIGLRRKIGRASCRERVRVGV